MKNKEKALIYGAITLIGGYLMKGYIFKIPKFNYFKYSEFADKKSGTNEMKVSTITMLDKARGYYGKSVYVTSGWRDDKHPLTIKNPTSSHNKGLAVDTSVKDFLKNRDFWVECLLKAGFTRIGIANNFVHCDNDEDKTQRVIWYYDGRDSVYF